MNIPHRPFCSSRLCTAINRKSARCMAYQISKSLSGHRPWARGTAHGLYTWMTGSPRTLKLYFRDDDVTSVH